MSAPPTPVLAAATSPVDAGQVTVGQALPPLTVRFSRTALVRYAGASGDFNPIHFSEHYAADVGLPGVVAHGMLTMASALRMITDWVGDPAKVTSYFVRFARPVVVPDDEDGVEVKFTGTVAAVDGSAIAIAIDATCAGQKVLAAARAEVDLGN
jgi:acyl dehydratase